jgi:transcriptional regulator with XRE-family HTH domain
MYDRIGNAIRRRRRQLDMSQAELAARMGVSREAVSQIERGRAPSLNRLRSIADALGVTPASLM